MISVNLFSIEKMIKSSHNIGHMYFCNFKADTIAIIIVIPTIERFVMIIDHTTYKYIERYNKSTRVRG